MEVRVKTLLNFFKNRYGLRKRISDPYSVLISTILSQRTKDEITEVTSERLFSVYKTPKEIANAPIKEIENLIKPSGFYRVKAARIKKISNTIVEKYGGKVPSTMEGLLSLPGVGRKTANCVLAFGFNIPAFPVDTHVHRISNRLGLAFTDRPEATEEVLKRVIPKEYWNMLNPLFVRFGQEICKPINPKCQECGLRDVCLYYFLQQLPQNFRESILEVTKRMLKRFDDIYSIVLIGSVAAGDYELNSDIDILCVKRKEVSATDITEITSALDRVQLIFLTEKSIAQHFKNSTTMAWAIKCGKIIFEHNDFWHKYITKPLHMPSKKWMSSWFTHWLRFYNDGTYDGLYRAVVNFAILFLETKGTIPTTKKQILTSFKKIVSNQEIIKGLEIALNAHHERRILDEQEKRKVFKAGEWLRMELTNFFI